jgi:hypothetical protein
MNCNECLLIIEEYIEDSLDPQASQQVAAHVAACGACREIYEELKNEQEIYSRYLLKIKEKPKSWDAVRAAIRKGNSVAAANVGTRSARFYERFSAVFFRQPLFGTMAVLFLVIGIGFGWWYRTHIQKDEFRPDLASSSNRESDLSLNEKKDDRTFPDNSIVGEVKVKSAKNESQLLKETKGGVGKNKLTAYAVRPSNEKKRAKSVTAVVANKINESSVSFDSSEVAFNRHIEKCEMVLRSFRNAVLETDESGFDISYERRLSKELLNNTVRFRREAQSQGNLPVEKLLVGLEAILGDITKLPEKANFSDAKLIKGRIRESGIIAKLQVQSSAVRASD